MQPMNGQNPAMMNEYPYYYYNPSYQFPPNMYGIPSFYPSYMMEQPKTLEESLSFIYRRGIVNNLIGAFFIKECTEKQKFNEKRKVPISMVEFSSEQENNNNSNEKNEMNNENKKDEEENNGGDANENDSLNKNEPEENKEEGKEINNENEKEVEDEKSIENKSEINEKEEIDINNRDNSPKELKKPDFVF